MPETLRCPFCGGELVQYQVKGGWHCIPPWQRDHVPHPRIRFSVDELVSRGPRFSADRLPSVHDAEVFEQELRRSLEEG